MCSRSHHSKSIDLDLWRSVDLLTEMYSCISLCRVINLNELSFLITDLLNTQHKFEPFINFRLFQQREWRMGSRNEVWYCNSCVEPSIFIQFKVKYEAKSIELFSSYALPQTKLVTTNDSHCMIHNYVSKLPATLPFLWGCTN